VDGDVGVERGPAEHFGRWTQHGVGADRDPLVKLTVGEHTRAGHDNAVRTDCGWAHIENTYTYTKKNGRFFQSEMPSSSFFFKTKK
jgi:hypothetical protein